MEKRYSHVGIMERSENGSFVITAESGAKYTVDQGVAAIWKIFNNNTPEEVSSIMSGGSSPEEVKKAVRQVAEKLFDLGLLKPTE